jgi:putative GTP pyrophosphokinase
MKQKSQQPINDAEYRDQYAKNKNQYDKLGVNLVQALELFLKERDIKVLSINHRVKDDSSFAEKIDRKHYANPFDEIEDICGIRIICYYQSDVEKISEVLREEFTVIENQDKETLLKADQFGYRSTHFIVKIKKEWNKAPNYRGLENLKAEIQIRTVLMHAWAEIEHKLVYKNENQVPSQFQRDFSELSALLGMADKGFERLRENITNYKAEVTESFEKDAYEDVELNLDSLQAFLDKHFPHLVKNASETIKLIELFNFYNVSLKELLVSYKKLQAELPNIERRLNDYYNILFQPSMAFFIVAVYNTHLYNEEFTGENKVKWSYGFKEILQFSRKTIAAEEAAKNKSLK